MRAHSATTRHVQSVFPFVGSDGSAEGVVIGQDAHTAEVVAYDPWLLADRGVISGPNMVVFGLIGTGKSSLVKTYLLRSLCFGVKSRILDPKGEYVRVADAVEGSQVVQVGLDGDVRINPLDVQISAELQRALVEALVEATAAERVGVMSRAVLASTLKHLRGYLTEPTLRDLCSALWTPLPAVIESCGGGVGRVKDAAAPVAAALELVLDGDLATLVGGASTVQPDPECPMLVADVSRIVPLGGTAVASAMAVVGTWLQAVMARRGGRQIIVLDECWRLLRDASTARWLQSSTKLAREYEAQLLTVFHRLTDLSAVGDAGTEQVQIARGLISDAETRVIYRQTAGDVAELGQLLGLSQTEVQLVPRLGRAVGLWRIGGRSIVVRHPLSRLEAELVETEVHRRRALGGSEDPEAEVPDELAGLALDGAAGVAEGAVEAG